MSDCSYYVATTSRLGPPTLPKARIRYVHVRITGTGIAVSLFRLAVHMYYVVDPIAFC